MWTFNFYLKMKLDFGLVQDDMVIILLNLSIYLVCSINGDCQDIPVQLKSYYNFLISFLTVSSDRNI